MLSIYNLFYSIFILLPKTLPRISQNCTSALLTVSINVSLLRLKHREVNQILLIFSYKLYCKIERQAVYSGHWTFLCKIYLSSKCIRYNLCYKIKKKQIIIDLGNCKKNTQGIIKFCFYVKKKSRMRSERKRSKELEDWKQYRARKCVYARQREGVYNRIFDFSAPRPCLTLLVSSNTVFIVRLHGMIRGW